MRFVSSEIVPVRDRQYAIIAVLVRLSTANNYEFKE